MSSTTFESLKRPLTGCVLVAQGDSGFFVLWAESFSAAKVKPLANKLRSDEAIGRQMQLPDV
jgi:hypothetical protein